MSTYATRIEQSTIVKILKNANIFNIEKPKYEIRMENGYFRHIIFIG